MAELKLPSKLTSFEDVSRAFRELEKNINTLHKTKSVAEFETKETEGESGDIRATRNVDGTYTFEVRTKEGWKTPALGNSVIKFKDKPSTISQNIVKSIDDLEADDTTTGANEAVRSIFDEKENQFSVKHLTGIPKPDFDSGWLRMVRNDARVHEDPPMRIYHNLDVFPRVFHFYFAPGQGSGSIGDAVDESEITWFTELETSSMGDGYNKGSAVYVSKTEARMHCADEETYVGSNFTTGASDHRTTYTNGTLRFIAWK